MDRPTSPSDPPEPRRDARPKGSAFARRCREAAPPDCPCAAPARTREHRHRESPRHEAAPPRPRQPSRYLRFLSSCRSQPVPCRHRMRAAGWASTLPPMPGLVTQGRWRQTSTHTGDLQNALNHDSLALFSKSIREARLFGPNLLDVIGSDRVLISVAEMRPDIVDDTGHLIIAHHSADRGHRPLPPDHNINWISPGFEVPVLDKRGITACASRTPAIPHMASLTDSGEQLLSARFREPEARTQRSLGRWRRFVLRAHRQRAPRHRKDTQQWGDR